jgi:hypothetical protein
VRTGVRAAVVVLIALAGAWFVRGGAAHAGGSTWNLDRESSEPGDVVTGWASIAWEHNPDLGTPEDGPYFAFVAPVGPGFRFGTAATIPDGAIRVAEIQVHVEPYDAGGVRFGPHHATLQFTVPDQPPGMYEIWHCNDPCTTTLGDLSWGVFWIGPVGERAPVSPNPLPPVIDPATSSTTTTTSTSVTTTTVPAPSLASATAGAPAPSDSSASVFWVAGGVALAVVAGAVALQVRKRDDPQG